MKVKYIIILLFALEILSCNTQEVLVSEFKLKDEIMLEPGKCYINIMGDDIEQIEKEKAFIMKLVSPKYELVKKVYLVSELELQFKEKDKYPIRIEPASIEIEIRNEEVEEHYPNEVGYLFCLIEKPPKYLYFDRNELKSDQIEVTERVLKSGPKIIKEYVKKKPKRLKENEFYFEEGKWLEPRELITGTNCPSSPLISKLKEKLNSLGYDLDVNDSFDEATKKALIHFQKKNDLKEGTLNYETLKKLNISYK